MLDVPHSYEPFWVLSDNKGLDLKYSTPGAAYETMTEMIETDRLKGVYRRFYIYEYRKEFEITGKYDTFFTRFMNCQKFSSHIPFLVRIKKIVGLA